MTACARQTGGGTAQFAMLLVFLVGGFALIQSVREAPDTSAQKPREPSRVLQWFEQQFSDLQRKALDAAQDLKPEPKRRTRPALPPESAKANRPEYRVRIDAAKRHLRDKDKDAAARETRAAVLLAQALPAGTLERIEGLYAVSQALSAAGLREEAAALSRETWDALLAYQKAGIGPEVPWRLTQRVLRRMAYAVRSVEGYGAAVPWFERAVAHADSIAGTDPREAGSIAQWTGSNLYEIAYAQCRSGRVDAGRTAFLRLRQLCSDNKNAERAWMCKRTAPC